MGIFFEIMLGDDATRQPDAIRRADVSDSKTIHQLVNEAYELETGNTGVQFKSSPRYSCAHDSDTMFDELLHTFVYVTHSGEIRGSIKAEVTGDTVHIGPVA